jgi:putative toxin-antitoxin system antitoxin component (TIGR02293 family)
MALLAPPIDETPLDRTIDLLGGAGVLHARPATPLETHDLLQAGLSTRALDHLVGGVGVLKHPETLERALGISERTYYRRKKETPETPLSREQSGRVWTFAKILSRATALFGSLEAAEQWLEAPAMALDQRRPIDLFSTPAGVETLETYLTRLEYGVYA